MLPLAFFVLLPRVCRSMGLSEPETRAGARRELALLVPLSALKMVHSSNVVVMFLWVAYFTVDIRVVTDEAFVFVQVVLLLATYLTIACHAFVRAPRRLTNEGLALEGATSLGRPSEHLRKGGGNAERKEAAQPKEGKNDPE